MQLTRLSDRRAMAKQGTQTLYIRLVEPPKEADYETGAESQPGKFAVDNGTTVETVSAYSFEDAVAAYNSPQPMMPVSRNAVIYPFGGPTP